MYLDAAAILYISECFGFIGGVFEDILKAARDIMGDGPKAIYLPAFAPHPHPNDLGEAIAFHPPEFIYSQIHETFNTFLGERVPKTLFDYNCFNGYVGLPFWMRGSRVTFAGPVNYLPVTGYKINFIKTPTGVNRNSSPFPHGSRYDVVTINADYRRSGTCYLKKCDNAMKHTDVILCVARFTGRDEHPYHLQEKFDKRGWAFYPLWLGSDPEQTYVVPVRKGAMVDEVKVTCVTFALINRKAPVDGDYAFGTTVKFDFLSKPVKLGSLRKTQVCSYQHQHVCHCGRPYIHSHAKPAKEHKNHMCPSRVCLLVESQRANQHGKRVTEFLANTTDVRRSPLGRKVERLVIEHEHLCTECGAVSTHTHYADNGDHPAPAFGCANWLCSRMFAKAPKGCHHTPSTLTCYQYESEYGNGLVDFPSAASIRDRGWRIKRVRKARNAIALPEKDRNVLFELVNLGYGNSQPAYKLYGPEDEDGADGVEWGFGTVKRI